MESVLTFLLTYALIPAALFCWVIYEWYGLKRDRRDDGGEGDRD